MCEVVRESQNEAFFVGVVDFCNLERTEFDSSFQRKTNSLHLILKTALAPKHRVNSHGVVGKEECAGLLEL